MKLRILLLLALTSCGSEESSSGDNPAAATKGDAVDLAGGLEYYITCVPCHGAKGKGDGAASAALEPKPRDLSDKTWQASVDDEYLRKIIQYGGAAVGKAPTMPPNPLLMNKKAVLNGLIAHIRSLGK